MGNGMFSSGEMGHISDCQAAIRDLEGNVKELEMKNDVQRLCKLRNRLSVSPRPPFFNHICECIHDALIRIITKETNEAELKNYIRYIGEPDPQTAAGYFDPKNENAAAQKRLQELTEQKGKLPDKLASVDILSKPDPKFMRGPDAVKNRKGTVKTGS